MKPESIVALGGVITLIGAAISIYGSLWTGQQQTTDAKKLADAQTELANAQAEGVQKLAHAQAELANAQGEGVRQIRGEIVSAI